MLRRMTLAAALLLSGASLWAGDLLLKGTADKETALYQPGEKMVFSVQLLDDGKPLAGKKLLWKRSGDDGKTENGEAVSSATEPLTVASSIDKPGFVRIEVWAVGEDGKKLQTPKNAKDKTLIDVRFDGGAGVEIDKLQGVPEPADFDAFWDKQKAELAKVPMKFTMTPVESKDPALEIFDVKVDCAGGKPVSGYYTRPKGAAPKSLPAQANFIGYSVVGSSPSHDKSKLSFTINAHGIENGREQEYYDKLKNGELKKYAFIKEENVNPETSYFKGMMLRDLRGLEFLKAQPEWNGRDLTVQGGSQGGLQALSMAGLDHDVTKCYAGVPWCCDLGGGTLGRLRGWFPEYVPGLDYFDSANQAKRIKCETIINAGLGDYTCPPSSVCVMFNNIKAPKQLEFSQGRTHGYMPPNPVKFLIKGNYPEK